MRINTATTPVATRPEQTAELDAARAVAPVQPRTPGAREAAGPAPVASAAARPAPVPPEAERRQEMRRGEDRRKRQVAVLIDTRVGQRRARRGRGQDDVPPSIDVDA